MKKRIYKFRFYKPSAKKMIYPGELGTIKDLQAADDWIVMQYVGINDIEGKEIYVGDLLEGIMAAGGGMQKRPGKKCLFEVIEHNNCFGYFFTLIQKTDLKGDYRTYPSLDRCKIIGNIYGTE